MKSHGKHRKNFALMCTVVGAAVTLVSLAMTYSIFTESFRDWPTIMRWVLTLACCIAIEGTSAAFIYGLVYALTGLVERSVAFIGLLAVGIVMGINIITHSMQVRRIPTEAWQDSYVAWIGPGVLIGVFAIIVITVMVRFESRILAKERKIELLQIEATLDAQTEWLDSDDFGKFLDSHKQEYFEKIGQKLGLKPASVTQIRNTRP